MALGSELDFIRLAGKWFPEATAHAPLGRSDDCALLVSPGPLVLTTDLFVEDAHFRRSYFSPADIGHKGLAVNLSDLAAMGARPLGFALSLGIPEGLSPSFWEEFFRAMSDLAGRHGACLAGGDLSRSSCLTISVTAWGTPPRPPLTRASASPGDVLFVTGPSGRARCGLAALEESGPDGCDAHPGLALAHLRPDPHVDQGLALAHTGLVTSLMDVSDGLAADLPRLLGRSHPIPPDLGAEVILCENDLDPEMVRFCTERGLDPIREAWFGGEDYLLLGSAPKGALEEIGRAVPGVLPLGRVTGGKAILVNGAESREGGFDHFHGEKTE